MFYVVGSGPSGISVAHALASAGQPVTILDSGLTLERERQDAVAAFEGREPDEWNADELAYLTGPLLPAGDVPLKLAYGSDYPYRSPAAARAIRGEGVTYQPSYAAGGFSNVWGSSILPYLQRDLIDWPITADELAEGYARVLEFMPIAAEHDELEVSFPLFSERPASLPTSRQAAMLLQNLRANRPQLADAGLEFGRARVAVDAAGTRTGSGGCMACGLCLHGCPRGLIYSSQHTLAALRKRPEVRYIAGVTVHHVEERDDRVLLRAENADGPLTFEGERAFLGAGPVNTTAILMRSLGMYDAEVLLQDSQYFLFPAFSRRGVSGVTQEPLHTLCQAFLEISDEAVSPNTVHCQVYTYNAILRALLLKKLGPLARVAPTDMILGRMFLFQSYLHSRHSGRIALRLNRAGGSDEVHMTPRLSSETVPAVRRVLRKLAGLSRATGVLPVAALAEITEPGRGFHTGGSFPMARAPRPGQTDRLGRPFGLNRTHAVDATVFSSIAATTITFTVMANAYRIGQEVARGGELRA